MPKKPFIFVVMPFAPEFSDEYALAIKPACEAAGAVCQRVDEQIFLRSILERIYSEIERADLVVAEMSGQNQNVFYEVGYAHGLGKAVVLLTKSAGDIPFDLRPYPHVVHEGSLASLREKLEEVVRWAIANPEELAKQSPRYSDRAKAALVQIGDHVANYLRANRFEMMSFERIRANINQSYGDDILQRLIEVSPGRFRRVKLKGGKHGIGLVSS